MSLLNPAKNASPGSNHEKTSDPIQIKGHAKKNNWPAIFKIVKVMKVKEGLRNDKKLTHSFGKY